MTTIFTIKARQWVEELTTLHVEAETAEEALQMVERDGLLSEADWEDGSDIDNTHVYAIDAPGQPEVLSFDQITEIMRDA